MRVKGKEILRGDFQWNFDAMGPNVKQKTRTKENCHGWCDNVRYFRKQTDTPFSYILNRCSQEKE